MADEADDAQKVEELNLRQAIANMKAAVPRLTPNGVCYNPRCEAEIEPVIENGQEIHKALFCDGECATEYERVKKRF